MAVAGAFPKHFASIHPRYLTPAFGTIVIGVAGDGLVRRGQRGQRQLPLRLALGPVASDRLLLRAHRGRLRDLLPPRAVPVGEEPALHRRRAPRSARVMLLYLLYESVQRARPIRAPRTRARRCSGSASRSSIALFFFAAGLVLMVALAVHRRRRVLPPQAVRGRAARRSSTAAGKVAAVGASEAEVERDGEKRQDPGWRRAPDRRLRRLARAPHAAFDAADRLRPLHRRRIVIAFGYEPPGYGEEMGPYREVVRDVTARR